MKSLMRLRVQVFGSAALLAALAALTLALGRAELGRRLVLGPPLLEVSLPAEGATLDLGGVSVLVSFPDPERVLPETFRCVVNGRDVTEMLTRGRNGAGGALYPLREGENRLRLAVFGRSWWRGSYYEEERTVTVRVRPLPFLDRAARRGPPLA